MWECLYFLAAGSVMSYLVLTAPAFGSGHTGFLKMTRKSWKLASSSAGQFPRIPQSCKGYKCGNDKCYPVIHGMFLRCCPGTSSLYNPRTQICCDGNRVHAITSPDKPVYKPDKQVQCCSDQVYSTEQNLCCDGQLRALYDSSLQNRMHCCGRNSFNPLMDTCCDGILTNGIEDGECCETIPGVQAAYNPVSHLCCRAGNHSNLWSRRLNDTKRVRYCCGAEAFEPNAGICCAATIQLIEAGNVRPRCCGSVVFDAATELCCAGRVLNNRRQFTRAICCGNKIIDGSQKICCSGRVQSTARGKISCCGAKSYNRNKHTCCRGKVNYDVALGHCCGEQAYLSSQSTCCKDQITHVPSVRGAYCCDSRGYEPIVQMCCGRKLVELTAGTDVRCCCGGLGCKTFKSDSQVCCSNGNVIKKRGEQLCCAGEDSQRLYDPRTETCCSGNVSKSSVHGHCCGDVPYSTRRHYCCRGHLHSRSKGSRCCNTQLYNANTAVCTNGQLGTLIHIPPGYGLCKTTLYDPKKKLCCSGYHLSDRVYGSASACCSARIYNQNTHCCCRGRLHVCPAGTPRCCYTQIYDQLTQICDAYTGGIRDKLQPRLRFCGAVKYDPAGLRCCGNSAVYGSNRMCCGEKLHDAPGVKLGQGACCNGRPYNKVTQLCCHGNIWSKSSNVSCCGYRVYDMRTAACCGGKVFTAGFTCCHGKVHWTPGSALGKGGCCNGIGFNRETQICCGGKVFIRSSHQVTCCEGRPYDASQKHHLCCHDNLATATLNSTEIKCCRKQSYDAYSETCCDGRVHKAGRCCGKNLINRSDDICCGNIAIFRNSGAHKQCCGAVLYNTKTEFCARNSIIRSRAFSPCGVHFYKNSTQLCCAGEIFAKREKDRCCSTKKYDRRFSICCDGQVFPKSSVACADRKPCMTDSSHKSETRTCCQEEIPTARQKKCVKNGSVPAKKMHFTQFIKRLCSSDLVFLGTYSSRTKNGSFIFANVSILKPASQTRPRSYTIPVGEDTAYFTKSGGTFIVAGRGGTGDVMTAVSESLRSSRKTLRKTKKALKRCQES